LDDTGCRRHNIRIDRALAVRADHAAA
jgi:hypothetical protein